MGFNINSITSKITNSKVLKSIPQKMNNIGVKIGSKFDKLCSKSDTFQKVVNALEPNGGDNSWFLMLGLMAMVVGPRITTAAKRNPDNKEATKDEIKEILFRDIQTISIIMLSLKAMNALISAAAGKMSGIPMSNKPYIEMFNSKGLKNKAMEFIQEPLQKTKILFKNIFDTINPIGGKKCYTTEESIAKYSGFSDMNQIRKMFDAAINQKGDGESIFGVVIDSLIKKQQDVVNNLNTQAVSCANKDGSLTNAIASEVEKAKDILKELTQLKEQGYKGFKNNNNISKANENLIISFFKDSNNALVQKVVNLNAQLKTLAYGIEVGYLGFGLPYLNQKRLEKKYLKTKKEQMPETLSEIKNISLTNKNLKEHEVKLYHNFIK